MIRASNSNKVYFLFLFDGGWYGLESETSGIVRLGIVLIALAVLIGLGFGIFQISKSVANDGITDVQTELDAVSLQKYSSYDQKIITGTMLLTAMKDFEGESVAILVANQAWKNVLGNTDAKIGDLEKIMKKSSGLQGVYGDAKPDIDLVYHGIQLPIVWAYDDKEFTDEYKMYTSSDKAVNGVFINYNALIGGAYDEKAMTNPLGTTDQIIYVENYPINTAGIYFDENCWICTSGFATDANSRVIFNKITVNLSKSGKTEFIPSGAKFDSYLLKDETGTIMGIVVEQIGK